MIKETYHTYTDLGLHAIPIEWDTGANAPRYHVKGWNAEATVIPDNRHNGLMIHTAGEYACIDIDLKNTDRKDIYESLLFNIEDFSGKLYIEQTRSKGYHIWFRYNKIPRVKQLAGSPTGAEVIALYANGPLVYTWPTPGYTQVSGCMEDIELLTPDEWQCLFENSQALNEYKPAYDPNNQAISYPPGMEKYLLSFDNQIPDEYFDQILKDIGLVQCDKQPHNAKYVAFRRAESESSVLGAKVYYRSKRVLIFSASMVDYPNWHRRHDYECWSLTPSFLLYYKNGRDWSITIEVIQAIVESIGMDIESHYKIVKTNEYPLHVWPEYYRQAILDVCEARSLAVQFVATAGIWAVSSLSGTRYVSDFNGEGKNIIFALLIAPISVGKTPSYRVMVETPLAEIMKEADFAWAKTLEKYRQDVAKAKREKKEIPERPHRFVPFAVDGTTEAYMQKSVHQPLGLGVYQDEAETIMNAGSFKSNNDAISFFTQAFSGGRQSQLRVDEEKERIIPNINMNLLMGTQPSRLKNIFTEDRLAAGFPSRFLLVEADYQRLNIDTDPFGEKKEMCRTWVNLMVYLYKQAEIFNFGGGNITRIVMTEGAKETYRTYYRTILEEANYRIENKFDGFIIGTEAKMSAYLPRLIQILAIINNPINPIITPEIVHNGWHLYRYHAASTISIIRKLHTEIETGLPTELDNLYQALPDTFTTKEAEDCCKRVNLPGRRFRDSMRRKDFAALFRKIEHGKYCKVL